MPPTTSRENHADIRIGTLAPMDRGANYLRQILPHGFESIQLTLWKEIGAVDLERAAAEACDAVGGKAVISSVALFGNPLQEEQAAKDWETLIRNTRRFGCSLACGFAGALEDRPVDQQMDRFREVWGHLARVADGEGVRIAFENCDMGGTWELPKWNVAHSPRAWEMMFDAVPRDTLGLEWEPCHQMGSLVDPLPQLRKWVDRVYHVHGKDATIAWDVIREQGLRGGTGWVWHRTPGFGDTNWTDVITILRQAGYRGSIDIEGWHDPVYRDDLEMTGQVCGMEYLKRCRGGAYVANPS